MPSLMSLFLQALLTALGFFFVAFLIGALIGAGYCGYLAAVTLLL